MILDYEPPLNPLLLLKHVLLPRRDPPEWKKCVPTGMVHRCCPRADRTRDSDHCDYCEWEEARGSSAVVHCTINRHRGVLIVEEDEKEGDVLQRYPIR